MPLPGQSLQSPRRLELETVKLSVVIPCFNERESIHRIVEAVKSCGLGNLEIVIVDDCSSDGTIQVLREEIEPLVDKVIYHPENRGKGAALRTGFQNVTGDIVAIQDADLEYDPRELRDLMVPILEHGADVVFGSRFQGGRPHRVVYFWHMVGNRFLTFLSNCFTNLNLSDMETCYKIFRREVLEKVEIKEERFGFEPEITAKIARLGCVVYEVGISYRGRTYEEGKKIGWKDGFRALYVIIRYGLFP
jgi:glycosyltransferase involved in cell wall biosynthesis